MGCRLELRIEFPNHLIASECMVWTPGSTMPETFCLPRFQVPLGLVSRMASQTTPVQWFWKMPTALITVHFSSHRISVNIIWLRYHIHTCVYIHIYTYINIIMAGFQCCTASRYSAAAFLGMVSAWFIAGLQISPLVTTFGYNGYHSLPSLTMSSNNMR